MPNSSKKHQERYSLRLVGTTVGRYCLIDMHIPPGGGPPPHRHDFEESFTLLDGEIEATFRSEKSVIRAGETINIPANAPYSFTKASKQTVRLLPKKSEPAHSCGLQPLWLRIRVAAR